MGSALAPVRNHAVIATKFGIKHGEHGPSPLSGLDSRPEQIRRVTEASLRHLRTDCIDLLYQHRVDPNVLTGKMDFTTPLADDDLRRLLPRLAPEAMRANQALVDVIEHIATAKQATPAQIALAWALAQKPWFVPIPGTTKLHRLKKNLGAIDLELTSRDLQSIEQAAAHIQVQGARVPENLQSQFGQ